VGFYLFLFKMSNAVSTTAAGLYVVLNGGHLSTPTKGPQEPRPVVTTKTKTHRQEDEKNTTKNEKNT
jgi:hypothetical protein